MTIYIDGHSCHYEVQATCMLFLSGEPITLDCSCPQTFPARFVYTGLREMDDGGFMLTVQTAVSGPARSASRTLYPGDLSPDRLRQEEERAFGRMLYALLREQTGVAPPWGILTGVRPVKLFAAMMEAGEDPREIRRHFSEDMLVSGEKIELALETAQVQRPFLQDGGGKRASLYVAIPFCPTRCRYCSFVSHSIGAARDLLKPYTDMLCAEIADLARKTERYGLTPDAVYIGGGTPTALPLPLLEAVLRAVREGFGAAGLEEFTVEAGRPDTITRENLALLREYGVSRVSINPQTFNDKALRLSGRPHSAADAVDKYALAREYGFTTVNMDFIAGLEGDTPADFHDTIRRAVGLRPENITVHALSVKRSADLSPERAEVLSRGGAGAMIAGARQVLKQAGYRPYYLYRQKNTVENLENTGYSLPGHESPYNIRIMDESRTILAAGAGGVTKLVGGPNQITRIFNYKYPYEYISRFDELSARRSGIDAFFSRLENPPQNLRTEGA